MDEKKNPSDESTAPAAAADAEAQNAVQAPRPAPKLSEYASQLQSACTQLTEMVKSANDGWDLPGHVNAMTWLTEAERALRKVVAQLLEAEAVKAAPAAPVEG